MELQSIRLVPETITRGLEIVRNMKSLKNVKIGDDQEWPAAEFRARYDRGEFTQPNTKKAGEATDATARERSVAAMKPADQVKAVAARMKELNPGFDGVVVPTIENGVVSELAFNTDDVTDISPVRVLTGLRSLTCLGSGDRKSLLVDLSPLNGLPLTKLIVAKARLIDLSPLRGMPLTEFMCHGTPVDDLAPLAGMKLTVLSCAGTEVHDLSPLRGMPLKTLSLDGTKVPDLSALAGMALERLDLQVTTISDLSPLKGMKLTSLNLYATPVSDLSPLDGMNLIYLNCGGTKVSDLSPLNGMPLTHLDCAGTRVNDASLAHFKDCKHLVVLYLDGTQVSDAGLAHLKDCRNLKILHLRGTEVSDLSLLEGMPLTDLNLVGSAVKDLSPLEGLPLENLRCDFQRTRDTKILRMIKTLKTINGKPAAQFWKELDVQAEK